VVEAATEETRSWLQDHGSRPVAASPHAEKPYTELDLTGPTAIVVGAEQYGLSPDWLAGDQALVRIPMRGQADSLNVATAATLLLYEAVRQRGARDSDESDLPSPPS
jgi:TrmH family RNA methyltransferase